MKRRDILFLLISGAVLTILWIIFTILHQAVSTTISDDVSQQIAPITSKFDRKIIDALKKRPVISPEYNLKNVIPTPLPTFVPTPTPTPITFIFQNVTPLISSPVATQGGVKK